MTKKPMLDVYDEPHQPVAKRGLVGEEVLAQRMAKARYCQQCGQEARIVSDGGGVQAFCGPCKIDWPVGIARTTMPLPSTQRGLSRETIVQPDVSVAFEEDPQSYE